MFVRRLSFTQLDFTVVPSSQGWGNKGDETASLPSGGWGGGEERPPYTALPAWNDFIASVTDPGLEGTGSQKVCAGKQTAALLPRPPWSGGGGSGMGHV